MDSRSVAKFSSRRLTKFRKGRHCEAMPAGTSPLRQAFDILLAGASLEQRQQIFALLLTAAAPEQQRQILGAGIAALIAEPPAAAEAGVSPPPPAPPAAVTEPARPPRRRHAGRFLPADPARWAELRPQLQARLRTTEEMRAAAPALGLDRSSLRRVVLGQRPPGAAVVRKAEIWLAAQGAAAVSREAEAEAEADPERLSIEQRDRLAFVLQHDPAATRRSARVSAAELDQAIAGEALDPATVTRLCAFLAG
jgi:hypothetical protein